MPQIHRPILDGLETEAVASFLFIPETHSIPCLTGSGVVEGRHGACEWNSCCDVPTIGLGLTMKIDNDGARERHDDDADQSTSAGGTVRAV